MKSFLIGVVLAVITIDSTVFATDCNDSPLKFKVQISGKNKRRRCDWVNEDPVANCAIAGVDTMCRVSCGTCAAELCTDTTMEFRFKKSKVWQTCDDVSDNTVTRCALEGVIDTCREACGACSAAPSIGDTDSPSLAASDSPSLTDQSAAPSLKASDSPSLADSAAPSLTDSAAPSLKASDSPSLADSAAPSLTDSAAPSLKASDSPSLADSAAPSFECTDSILTFRTVTGGGATVENTCQVLVDNAPVTVCTNLVDLPTHCPLFCGNCGCIDSEIEFDALGDGNFITCSDVATTPSLCSQAGVLETCRLTCTSCVP